MDKSLIRQKMKSQRAKLSKQMVEEYSKAIWSKIYQMPLFQDAMTILLYSSIGNEVDTIALAKSALAGGKKIAYPVTNMSKRTMTFHRVDSLDDLVPVKSGSFSLLEPRPDPHTKIIPSELTLMIVPGLAFDKNLYRLGYGGGFYDKYLDQYPCLATIGVCYDFQVVATLPVDGDDRPVQVLVTSGR